MFCYVYNNMSSRYTSVIDSETYCFISDNAIVEIDSHLGVPIPHGQYSHPEVTPRDLDLIIEQLRALGSSTQAQRIEIEKRHLEDNSSHIFRFVAKELGQIVMTLAIAKTKLAYQGDMDSALAISSFGRLVTQSTTDLVSESLRHKEIRNIKPISGEESFVDPFKVIASTQQLAFVDAHGKRIKKQDITASDHFEDS